MVVALFKFLVFDFQAVNIERNLLDFLIFLIELVGKFFNSNVQNFRCHLIAKALFHFIGRYFLLSFVSLLVSVALKRTLRLFLRQRIFFGLFAQLFECKIALVCRALLIIAVTDTIYNIF